MDSEQVRIWRSAEEDGVMLMAGRTTHYSIAPRAQYVFGIIADHPMLARRGARRWLVQPGQIVAWDPSEAHAGTAADGQPWSARLMVIDAYHLTTLATDQESEPRADVSFPEPVLSDFDLHSRFLRIHVALQKPTIRLERDGRLAEWLWAIIGRSSTLGPNRSSLSTRDERAMRLAHDYLGDQPERNISLDELAAAAGIGKFRLLRLFRAQTGLPPHALQIAHRIRHAQRLLETGHTIAETAAATGFADQSHLHRHFRRGLGMTPREYQKRLTG
jgi:AraC-like DNA-binding protein